MQKKSGKDFSRLVYREMRSKMRFGDVLVIHDLSRFGRNKQEILNEWKRITDDEIDIVILNLPILDTRKYKESIMNIHRETGLSRNTISMIKKEINDK